MIITHVDVAPFTRSAVPLVNMEAVERKPIDIVYQRKPWQLKILAKRLELISKGSGPQHTKEITFDDLYGAKVRNALMENKSQVAWYGYGFGEVIDSSAIIVLQALDKKRLHLYAMHPTKTEATLDHQEYNLHCDEDNAESIAKELLEILQGSQACFVFKVFGFLSPSNRVLKVFDLKTEQPSYWFYTFKSITLVSMPRLKK